MTIIELEKGQEITGGVYRLKRNGVLRIPGPLRFWSIAVGSDDYRMVSLTVSRKVNGEEQTILALVCGLSGQLWDAELGVRFIVLSEGELVIRAFPAVAIKVMFGIKEGLVDTTEESLTP